MPGYNPGLAIIVLLVRRRGLTKNLAQDNITIEKHKKLLWRFIQLSFSLPGVRTTNNTYVLQAAGWDPQWPFSTRVDRLF
jgi:hypothetical protein